MAIIEHMYFYGDGFANSTMTVTVKLHPYGEVRKQVTIPAAFMKALLSLAQHAADLHEAQMKAQLLGELHAKDNSIDSSGAPGTGQDTKVGTESEVDQPVPPRS